MNSTRNSARRVVITGIGVVSPIGIGADAFWRSLADGTSGIGPIQGMSHSAAPRNVGGEVSDFTESGARETWLKSLRKMVKVMCREIQLGVASAAIALEHSGLDLERIDHDRFGVDFGASGMLSPPDVLKGSCFACSDGESRLFDFQRWGGDGLANMEPLWLLKYLPNMPACHIGILADARGPNNSLTLAEASGNLVLGEAFRIIRRGSAELMITGTTGTKLHPVKCLHAAMWDELAESDDDPSTWSRPFDLSRNGQVVAEGACTFLCEEAGHAKSRGATVYGEVLGAASACVADRGGQPGIRAVLANAMQAALRDAGLTPQDVGHINAHGLGTKQVDIEEAAAIRDVFGNGASDVPVTALKSYFGNPEAGCGTLELAGSLLGLRHGVVPPTLNYHTPDPECPLNVVHGQPLATDRKVVLNVDVTRAGQASALVVLGA